jgi:hypothetical protein
MKRIWPTTLCLAVLLAGAILHESRGGSIAIVYFGNLDGELEPCGCTPDGNMGGLKRQVSIVDGLREKHPGIVLLSTGGLISAYTANEQLTAEYILKGFQRLSYDAIGVQWSDLAYGKGFILGSNLPWISTNWNTAAVNPTRVVERGGHKLFIASWLEGNPTVSIKESEALGIVEPHKVSLLLKQAKASGMTTVLMSPFSENESKVKFDLAAADIVIIKSAYEEFGIPRRLEGGPLVLEPGSRGKRLGKLMLDLKPDGRIESYQHEVIAMPPSVPDSLRMTDWYDEYNARVKENYLRSVEVRKSQREGLLHYVGEAVCKNCHGVQHDVWSRSRHAGAFDALRDVNKAFDPACIVCHTVGFNKESGYIDDLVTDYLRHVQCESCHGVGRSHVATNGKEPLGNAQWSKEKICGQCHVPKHSPKFNVAEYWPKIAH